MKNYYPHNSTSSKLKFRALKDLAGSHTTKLRKNFWVFETPLFAELSFRNFSNKENVGSTIFPALDLFVTFYGDGKK